MATSSIGYKHLDECLLEHVCCGLSCLRLAQGQLQQANRQILFPHLAGGIHRGPEQGTDRTADRSHPGGLLNEYSSAGYGHADANKND
jgi:hypothetical protein